MIAAMVDDALWPRAASWLCEAPAGPGERVDLALLGVPAHATSLSPTGAQHTPAAVRAALSRYGTWAYGGGVDLAGTRAVDLGDVTDPDADEGRTRSLAGAAAQRARLVVALGGDNSVTYAVARGVLGEELERAGLVTLDAHHDLRDGVSNGSPVRRLVEAGLDPRRVAQVGIADFSNSPAYAARARDWGIAVHTRQEVAERGMGAVLAAALATAASGGGPVYVDVDVDVCDRSVAPGCPASAPGGLSAWELRQAARIAGSHPAVRGLDVTEVDATSDSPDGRTVRLAALVVLEVAAGLAARTG